MCVSNPGHVLGTLARGPTAAHSAPDLQVWLPVRVNGCVEMSTQVGKWTDRALVVHVMEPQAGTQHFGPGRAPAAQYCSRMKGTPLGSRAPDDVCRESRREGHCVGAFDTLLPMLSSELHALRPEGLLRFRTACCLHVRCRACPLQQQAMRTCWHCSGLPQ